MSVTEAVLGPRTQSASLTAGKRASTVASGVGKRLFAVHPDMASEPSDIVFEIEVGVLLTKGDCVGREAWVGKVVCFARGVSEGTETPPIPGTTGCEAGGAVFPEAQAANNNPNSRIK